MTAAESFPIVDVDSHLTEPADLWTSRVPKKFVDVVPQIRRDAATGFDEWWVGDNLLCKPGTLSMAGWPEYIPSTPATYEQMDPASFDPNKRLELLDELGVWAQVLYPNILGFFSFAILELEPEARNACVRAYNDFLAEFASADPRRLVPIMFLPWWDVAEAVREIDRCQELGHKGIVFGWNWERWGLPMLGDDHWDPILSTAQERGLSVSFHVGANVMQKADTDDFLTKQITGGFDRLAYTRDTALYVIGNLQCVAHLICDGVCQRYPNLNFVSVESGFGYLPYFLELLDWQYSNSGAFLDHPDWPKPSEIFRRQIFANFWFERKALSLLEQYPDNVMFATDFPHPTSLSPGPASDAEPARIHVQNVLRDLPDPVVENVLGRTASKLYHVELPQAVGQR